MNAKLLSPQWERQRKRLLVLPLLTLPFITLAFWALGGGRGAAVSQAPAGLNPELPQPQLKAEKEDKLSFYAIAAAAEKKRREAMQSDPYWRDSLAVPDLDGVMSGIDPAKKAPEDPILQKLEQLSHEINQPARPSHVPVRAPVTDPSFTEGIARLEQMMQLMEERSQEDKDMEQLQTVLDRIVDIQHPERVPKSLPPAEVRAILPVRRPGEGAASGFYSLPAGITAAASNSLEVAVHGTQALVDGGLLKLRLLEEMDIAGTLIPRETFLWGQVRLDKERLQVHIPSIRHGTLLYPVALDVYDLDGLPGIHLPAALLMEVAQTSGNKVLQNFGSTTLGTSLSGQAAAAGLDAARTFLSKKAKQVKVIIRGGYRLLIKPKQS